MKKNDLFQEVINSILLNDLHIQDDYIVLPNKNRGQSITFKVCDINKNERYIIKFFDFLKGISLPGEIDINDYKDLDEFIENIEDIEDFSYNIDEVINIIELQKRCFDRYVRVGKISELTCFPKIYFSKELRLDNSFYGVLVEEFIHGMTLEERLVKGEINNKVFFVYDFLCQMGINLKQLSLYGLVHRDLSPDNIMIFDDKYIMIDPGVIKLEDGKATKSRMILGKKNYASPEQYAGNARLVTFKSDLYSIGIISLEILLGYNPLFKIITYRDIIYPHKMLLEKYDRDIEDDIYKAVKETNFVSRLLLIIKKLIQVDDRNRFDSIDSFLDSLKAMERMMEENE